MIRVFGPRLRVRRLIRLIWSAQQKSRFQNSISIHAIRIIGDYCYISSLMRISEHQNAIPAPPDIGPTSNGASS
jgi:hypothetical protein